MLSKIELRNKCFEIRNNLMQRSIYDLVILEKCKNIIALDDCTGVFTYVSMRSEVDTHGLIQYLYGRVPVCIPYTAKGEMIPVQLPSLNLNTNAYGNLEVFIKDKPQPISFKPSIAIVPMLAFNQDLFRVGYGGGYYDRFLKDFKGLKVGLAYDEQQAHFDPEPHDISLEIILTPQNIFKKGVKI